MMNARKSIILASLTLASLAAIGFSALADDDGDEHFQRPWGVYARPGVAPVTDRLYREECGSCHMVYPPGLLPAPSWERIMLTLEDHFGENAELDTVNRDAILGYLLSRSAGRVNYRLSNRLMRGVRGIPLRITELPYFRHEHREIPPRMVVNNPRVRSFSNCNACHRYAERGSFNEHEIRIPGYGRYEDDD